MKRYRTKSDFGPPSFCCGSVLRFGNGHSFSGKALSQCKVMVSYIAIDATKIMTIPTCSAEHIESRYSVPQGPHASNRNHPCSLWMRSALMLTRRRRRRVGQVLVWDILLGDILFPVAASRSSSAAGRAKKNASRRGFRSLAGRARQS
jgi:hypothetical protein